MSRTRREFLQTAAASAAWAASARMCGAELEGSSVQRPNIVVLMLDALRPDYTSAHGARAEASPWLGALAQRASVFDRCWSTSTWTAPACASLFTGLYPTEHGIVEGFMANSRRKERQEEKGVAHLAESGTRINTFAPDMVLLPQYLREFGYRCFGFATNPNVGPEIGFDRGFEQFASLPEGTADQLAAGIEPWREDLIASEDPYFLYLHYMDVHKPYHERAPWFEPGEGRDEAEQAAAAYRSELRYMDEHLAKLAEQWGWDEQTLILVVSDHGEEFGEHGGIGHPFQMHAELNRVLWMTAGPGVQAGRVKTPVALHDFLPTMLSWLSLDPPLETSGMDLSPLWRAEPAKSLQGRMLYAHRRKNKFHPLDQWAVNHERWRMILNDEGQLSLFDIVTDPLEQRPIPARDQPEIHEKLRLAVRAYEKKGIAKRAVMREIVQTDEQRAILERLGYADKEDSDG